MDWKHNFNGDLLDVTVRDSTRRTIYKNTFNIRDKNSIGSLLEVLEKFSGFSVSNLLKERANKNWWD